MFQEFQNKPYIYNSRQQKSVFEPQSKFTPLQLIPPLNRTQRQLKAVQCPSTVKLKKQKKAKPKFITDFDEIGIQDDQLEYAAYNVKPNDSTSGSTFRGIYKKIDVIMQKKVLYQNTKQSLFSSLAENSKIEKLMPRTLGIIRPNTDNKKKMLDASNFCMGDKYAKMLCQGVQVALEHFELVNLKNNNLTSKSSECLNQLIPSRIKELNLQNNRVGCQEFIISLNTRYGQLQHLNLENNRFNDQACCYLFKMLQNNTVMKKLNLSHNSITDNSMKEFSQLLIQNATLNEIYLHWNHIHWNGGQLIVSGLQQNSTLKVLDLSFNSLGLKEDRVKPNKIAWADYLGQSQLIHLDLSNNQFSHIQAELISKALEDNHSIYGFHFNGNSHTSIDHLGFLLVQSEENQSNNEWKEVMLKKYDSIQIESEMIGALAIPRIDGLKPINRQQQFYHEICWICDSWVEQTFLWQPEHLDIRKEPIFIHFSHEQYAPIKMELMDSSQLEKSPLSRKANPSKIWYVRRMIPTKQPIRFFFSSPLLKQSAISIRYFIQDWPKNEINKKTIFYLENGKTVTFKRPKQCNYFSIPYQIQFDEKNYDPNVNCQPRIKDYGGILDLIIDDQINDDQEPLDDFFKECHKDTDDDYRECFEWDWNNSQIPKLIKDQEQQLEVKQYLLHIYRDLVAAYRHYSAYTQDVFCISLNTFTDAFSSVFVDNKTYQLKDLDISFRQTTSKYINSSRASTSHSLLRYQFLEIIVRMAMDKYCRLNTITPLEAIKKVYEIDGLQKKIDSIQESQIWRENNYWNSDCNCVIQKNYSILFQLYQECVMLRQLQYFTTKIFVTPQSFKELFNRAGMINDSNAERNISIGFALSTQLVIDEINDDNHLQMNFYQFVEALARVSEKYKSLQQYDTLSNKIQNLILALQNYYQLVDEKMIQMPQPSKKPKKQATSFLQENVTKLVYEMDGSPILNINIPLNQNDSIE